MDSINIDITKSLVEVFWADRRIAGLQSMQLNDVIYVTLVDNYNGYLHGYFADGKQGSIGIELIDNLKTLSDKDKLRFMLRHNLK